MHYDERWDLGINLWSDSLVWDCPFTSFTEETKTNRSEDKSADYIDKMMLVGKQRRKTD